MFSILIIICAVALGWGINHSFKNVFSSGTLEAWYSPDFDEIHFYSKSEGRIYLSTGGSVRVTRKAVAVNCKYLGEL
ncbi:MAG: hypothetical protein COB41_00260 [Proteobacteria bacterium]|nr:MAG: hypothetical protein COB41_00260 [Pseudomonadota bacterium]